MKWVLGPRFSKSKVVVNRELETRQVKTSDNNLKSIENV